MTNKAIKKTKRPVGRPHATLSRSRLKWLRENADVPADVKTFEGVVAHLASCGMKDTTIGHLCGVDNETIKANFSQILKECRAIRALGLRKLTDTRSLTDTGIHKHRLAHELGESDKMEVESTGNAQINVFLPDGTTKAQAEQFEGWIGGAK